MPPETKYAKSGDVHIAYQVVGNGPIDLVLVTGFVSHIELMWEEPSVAQSLQRLASFSRLIIFDKRGTGMSDRVLWNKRIDGFRCFLHSLLCRIKKRQPETHHDRCGQLGVTRSCGSRRAGRAASEERDDDCRKDGSADDDETMTLTREKLYSTQGDEASQRTGSTDFSVACSRGTPVGRTANRLTDQATKLLRPANYLADGRTLV
jgi:hypothetical protein